MLLKNYSKEIFRPECNPSFESVHCIAHLEQDISGVLPYLNAVLGGFDYLKDPPAVIFRSQGKLITVHGNKIAINALFRRIFFAALKNVLWLSKISGNATRIQCSIVWEVIQMSLVGIGGLCRLS